MNRRHCDTCTCPAYDAEPIPEEDPWSANPPVWLWILVHAITLDLCPHCGNEPLAWDEHAKDCPTCGTCAQTAPTLPPPWHRDEQYVPTDRTWTTDRWREHLAAEHPDYRPRRTW